MSNETSKTLLFSDNEDVVLPEQVFPPKNASNKVSKKRTGVTSDACTASASHASAKQYRGLGQKILIFAHHIDVMDAIVNALQDDRVSYVRIDGSASTAARADRIAHFQNDDDTIVALLSIKVCGTGMNLTRANVALFAELDWRLD